MAFWKKLNNTDAVPVLKDEMVLDTTPTVNSTNPVTSDGIARAIAGASGEVPVVTENDNGKILTAIYDEGGPAVEWANAPSGVPEYTTSDDGKVLGVVVDSTGETPVAGLDWVEETKELPSITGQAGKLLTVNSGATGVEWADAPSELPAQLGTAGQVLSVNAGATGVEWADAPSGVPEYTTSEDGKVLGVVVSGVEPTASLDWVDAGSAYTAGDGIDITSNEVSVKVGNGLVIADTTERVTTQNMTQTPFYVNKQGWKCPSFCNLTSDLLASIRSKVQYITTAVDFSIYPKFTCRVAIYPTNSTSTYSFALFGTSTALTNSQLPSGSTLTFDWSQYDSVNSTLALEDIIANPTNFAVGVACLSNDSLYIGTVTPSPSGSETINTGEMFAYDTVRDAVNVITPVPAPGNGDSGKVLTVSNNSGAFGWAAAPSELPSVTGNAGKVLTVNSGATGTEWTNFTKIEVVQSLPASPTSGVLYIVTGA